MGKDLASKGYYNYTPMFVGVDGSAPAIKDIQLTSELSLADNKCNLYVLDTTRKFAKTFVWYTEEEFYDVDGWYFGEEDTPTDYTLKPGESLQAYAPCAVKFTHAGQVDLGAYDFTVNAGGQKKENTRPYESGGLLYH